MRPSGRFLLPLKYKSRGMERSTALRVEGSTLAIIMVSVRSAPSWCLSPTPSSRIFVFPCVSCGGAAPATTNAVRRAITRNGATEIIRNTTHNRIAKPESISTTARQRRCEKCRSRCRAAMSEEYSAYTPNDVHHWGEG